MRDKLQITAYEVIENPMEIQTAERTRQWMDETVDRFAYRCLPVAIANQVGWDLLCPIAFSAKWNGRENLDAIPFSAKCERTGWNHPVAAIDARNRHQCCAARGGATV